MRPLPERSFPRLNSCISSPTLLCAFRPYFLPVLRRPRDEVAVVRRERVLLPERRLADFARVVRREVAVVPLLRRDVAVARRRPLLLRRELVDRERDDLVRDPDDARDPLRERDVDLRVAIYLASYTVRRCDANAGCVHPAIGCILRSTETSHIGANFQSSICRLQRTQQRMTLFQHEPAETGRPVGITVLAFVMLAYAAVAAVYAVLLATERVSMSSGAWLIGGGFEVMGKWIFALYSLLHAVCAIGLLRLQKWALRLVSLLLLWGLLQVTPAISSAVADSRVYAIIREGIQILWRVVALRYVWLGSTKDAFDYKQEKPHSSQQ